VVFPLMTVGTDSIRLTQTIIGEAGQSRTSATGEFVLDGLADGSYQVGAMPPPELDRSGRNVSAFQTTYYPGAPREQAIAIRVTAADSIAGVDFPLLRGDLISISGRVVRTESDGRIEGFVVTGASSRGLVVESDGTFRVAGLKPGRYTVWVRARTPNGFEAAAETVDAFADVTSLQLPMSSTATIAGRVITVDGMPLPVAGFRVAAVWTVDGSDVDPIARDQAEVAADGAFAINGVFGDRTMRLIGLPAGWEIDRIASARREMNPLRLAPGERVELIIVIGRAAIRGRVTNPEGQPLANARVTATMVDASSGADPRLTTSVTTPRGTTESGEYTLRGLTDGLYLLEARIETPRDPRSGLLLPGEPEFLPTYYPGGGREEAIAVRVARGDVVSNITIPVTRQTLASITGQVVRRDHQHRIEAHLLAPESADQAVPVDADGRFSVTGLKPGRYAMWARTPTVSGLEAAFAVVDVAADAVEVLLVMTPTATISGRIIAIDGTSPPLADVRIAGAWTDAGKDVDVVWRDQAAVDQDGRFQLDGMFGERTLQVIDLPRGWTVERIEQDGRPASIVKLSPGAQAEVTILVRAAGAGPRDSEGGR
jgi:hypothetical protein